MEIFPAIDLKGGKCVRLEKGDFSAATLYDVEPLLSARNFENAGASWIHIVDLDGARVGEMQQFGIIAGIVGATRLKVQTGGGIRDEATIEKLLAAGVARVVIGSAAVKSPDVVKGWLQKFGPEKILLAFDIKINARNQPVVVTHGWQSESKKTLWEILRVYEDSGLKTIMCTDVGRDGMLTGTNVELYASLREQCPWLEVLASGGFSNLQELQSLSTAGVSGVIIGKAIYEGLIDLPLAIKSVRGA